MKLGVVDAAEAFHTLSSEWDALVSDSRNDVVQLTSGFLSAWWSNFGRDAEAHVVVLRDEGERLAAAAPFMKQRARVRGLPATRLSLMTNGHAPSSDMVIRSDQDADRVVSEILDHALDLPEVDIVELRKIDAGGVVDRAATEYLGRRGLRLGRRENTESPFIVIDSDWQTFFASRGSKFRRTMRNKLNRAAKAGDVTVERVEVRGREDPVLDEIVAVSGNSWKREIGEDLGSNPESVGFYADLCERFGPEGAIAVWVLRKGGAPAAFEFHLVYDGVTHPLRADFDTGFEKLSPGSVLECRILEALFESGSVRRYESCGHTYDYLLQWTDSTTPHVDLEIFPSRVRPIGLHTIEYRVLPHLRRLRAGLRRDRSGSS